MRPKRNIVLVTTAVAATGALLLLVTAKVDADGAVARRVHPILTGVPLLDRALATDPSAPDLEALSALNASAIRDVSLRNELMRRYPLEKDERRRFILREALVGSPTPDVVRFAVDLARDGEAARRAEGFELLANLPPSEATYRLARLAIERDHEPAVLRQAVNALVCPTPLPAAETRSLIAALRRLSASGDAELRQTSRQMLSYWESQL